MTVFNSNKETKMKGSLKKFTLTFLAVLAAMAGEAMAQCGGKTVYIQLPNDWGNNVYFLWESGGASARSANFVKEGAWTKITIPTGLSNDGANKQEIIFLSKKSDHESSQMWSISSTDIRKSTGPLSDNKFRCSDFGANGTWIMENPNLKGKVVVSTSPPDAYYLYFLPPSDEAWIIGTPWFVAGQTKEAMQVDPIRCGWFKITYFNKPVPTEDAFIFLGKDGSDKIGILGMDEDRPDWVNDLPRAFNLKEQFNRYLGENKPGSLFFVAEDGANGWYTTDPMIAEEKSRCTYSLAAVIYDSDNSVNCAFSQYSGASACNGVEGSGIKRGIVKTKLDTNTKKMEFNADNGSGWGNATNLNDAFNEVSGKSVMRCYDMPFGRTESGSWEFDSDRMTNKSGELVGGFFPDVLYPPYEGNPYASCPNCNRSNGISCSPNINVAATFSDVTWRGVTYGGIEAYNRSYLPDGALVSDYTGVGFSDCIGGGDPRPVSPRIKTGNNQYCFESHAEITYNGGEEFFFRGDDDIWIFINNRLVIDLGGTHRAAPGYVDLDTINNPKLVVGNKYPLDIFFCDRRGSESNVRISTNLYFSQKIGLYVQGDPEGSAPTNICLYSSGGGSCAAVTSGGASKDECGPEIGKKLEYYLQARNGTRITLNEDNEFCKLEGDKLTCYGGIVIYLNAGQVQVNTDPRVMYGLSGSYSIYVGPKSNAGWEPAPAPKRITGFSLDGKVIAVWDKVYNSKGLIRDLGPNNRSVVAGKIVPVGFTVGMDRPGGGFDVDEEAVKSTISLTLNQMGLTDASVPGSGVRIYEDSLGQKEVSSTETFRIPADGLLVLWVAGEYKASDEATYYMNPTGSKGTPFAITVYLPELRFIDPKSLPDLVKITDTIGSTSLADLRGAGTLGASAIKRGAFMNLALRRTIAAYDKNNLCTTCNFKMKTHAWVGKPTGEDKVYAEFGEDGAVMQFSDAEIKSGIANFSVRGKAEIEDPNYAFFTAGGPSPNPKTLAQWDSLLFKKPPVPVPELVEIYDRDGDGIGDSLRITYDRDFKGARRDSLPNMIEVLWDPNMPDTVRFGLATRNADGEFTNDGISSDANWEYWTKTAAKMEFDSVIVITGTNFSESVKTSVGSGNIVLLSWSTFENKDLGEGVIQTVDFSQDITDRMPPIVIAARYVAGKRGGGGSASSPREDVVTVTLSEPVAAVDGVPERQEGTPPMLETPFAYKLVNLYGGTSDFTIFSGPRGLPRQNSGKSTMRWELSGKSIVPDTTRRDSIVRFSYNYYRIADNPENSSETPIAGDSVKFAFVSNATQAFVDLAGNAPREKCNVDGVEISPCERGRRIEGENEFRTDKVRIAELDPNANTLDRIREALEGTGVVLPDNTFSDGRQAEFLPILPGWTLTDIAKYYPGTVGVVLRPDIANKAPSDIRAENITFYSNAFYHTNLGNYVVGRENITVKCNDPIFVNSVTGSADCRGKDNNSMALYIAWDLKDEKNRWVGAGAYVQVYDFYWKVVQGTTNQTYDKISKQVEMLGVKRVK